jgi:hypothetical protein
MRVTDRYFTEGSRAQRHQVAVSSHKTSFLEAFHAVIIRFASKQTGLSILVHNVFCLSSVDHCDVFFT